MNETKNYCKSFKIKTKKDFFKIAKIKKTEPVGEAKTLTLYQKFEYELFESYLENISSLINQLKEKDSDLFDLKQKRMDLYEKIKILSYFSFDELLIKSCLSDDLYLAQAALLVIFSLPEIKSETRNKAFKLFSQAKGKRLDFFNLALDQLSDSTLKNIREGYLKSNY